MYTARIMREIKKYGPGVFALFKDNELIYDCEVITGGSVLDSHEYGGLTPEVDWVMIENIQRRRHPSTGRIFEMARLIPLAPGFEKFKKRTIDIMGYPFMTHGMGISTGCPGPLHRYFPRYKRELNEAREEGAFPICVRNKNENPDIKDKEKKD